MADSTETNAVTVEEAAILLSTSPEAIRKRIYRGTLSASKDGGRWMVYICPEQAGLALDGMQHQPAPAYPII